MRYTVIINTQESETVWNALRFATTALSRGNNVTVFLLGAAVEIDTIINNTTNPRIDIAKLIDRYMELGGEGFSCGTCLTIRDMEASESCPRSSMDELVRLTEEADRTLVFG